MNRRTTGARRHSGGRWQTAGGQAITEFALISPLLLGIIFAIIQFSVLIEAKSAVTFATREGARVASIHGSEPTANDQICAGIRAGLTSGGLNPDNLGTVTIYKAVPGVDASADPSDVGTCTGGHWNYQNAGWPFYARNVVVPPDPIGISLSYNFHFLIPMFGSGLTISDGTILQVEPLYALGSSGATLPTPYPTFTPTPYPTSTPYPEPTPYPTFTPTACPPTATPTSGATATPSANTPTATATPGGC